MAVSKPTPSAPKESTSSLYQEFLAEREELLRHKWFLSEQRGTDVGFEVALADWAEFHRSEWRRNRSEAAKL